MPTSLSELIDNMSGIFNSIKCKSCIEKIKINSECCSESFIKNYDENSNAGYFREVDIDYPKESFNFHKDLPFLPERKKVEKVEKLICSIENNKKYVIHI